MRILENYRKIRHFQNDLHSGMKTERFLIFEDVSIKRKLAKLFLTLFNKSNNINPLFQLLLFLLYHHKFNLFVVHPA